MATTTITAFAGEEWTALVVGSAFASCQVQVTSPQRLALAVATSEPASDTDDFVIIDSDQPLVPFTLSSTETVWGRGFNGTATVRIIQVGV